MNSPKICIIGLKCLDHLAGEEVPRYLGGIETQLATLAKGLAAQGCGVSVITFDHGQSGDLVIEGVRVLKSHAPEGGVPLLRTLHPRTTGLFRAMKEAAADVYLQMGAGIETGQTALACRLLGRPFVFCLASDANFGAHLTAGRWGLEGRGYLAGLRQADRIIAQTPNQREGLRRATGLDSHIIPMAVVPPAAPERSPQDGRPHVLWVGRITPGKRLDWLLEAARHCPEVIFDIVGTPNQQSEHAVRLMEEARQLPNAVVHGRAPASVLAGLYRQAALLCCTSELEGFPTTFLEAWSCGLPVLTTFDPAGVVATHGLGEVAADLPDFIARLQRLLAAPESLAPLAAAAGRHFEANHSVEAVCRQFRQMLERAVRGVPESAEPLENAAATTA